MSGEFQRPPREVYVRSSRPTATLVTVEPGVEYREGDDFQTMTGLLNYEMFKADDEIESDPVKVAVALEERIKARWPDRAYFVEVHDRYGNWIQVFQPFGLPRNKVESTP